MSIPLLTTDYFTKPEPTGSISPTVARIMAQAGAAVGARVEKAQEQLEARTLAPVITQGYGQAYKKIAAGDMSGFSDMMAVKGLAAANPLLAQLSRDADTLGVHIANNVTQSAVLKERLAGQAAMATQRTNEQGVLQDDRQLEAAQNAANAENAKRQARNNERIAAAQAKSRMTGQEVQPTGLEELMPTPTATRNPVTVSPMGLPVQGASGASAVSGGIQPAQATQSVKSTGIRGNPDLPLPTGGATTQPAAQNQPAQQLTPEESASQDQLSAFVKTPAISDIMQKHGIMASDFSSINETNGVVSLTREGDGKSVSLSREESTAVMDAMNKAFPTQNAPPTPAVKAADPQPATVGGKKVDKVDFGKVTLEIGAPSEDEQMQLKQTILKTPEGSEVYEKPNFSGDKEGNMKARTTLIESLGTMKADAPASEFLSNFLGDKGGKGVIFPPEGIVRDGKSIISAKMYGIDKDGNHVPYNPTTVTGPDGKKTEEVGRVSGEFVKAYSDAMKVMDVVKNKYGVTPKREEEPAKSDPFSVIEDPKVKKVAMDAKAEYDAVPASDAAAKEAARIRFKEKVRAAESEAKDAKLRDNKYGKPEDLDQKIADEQARANGSSTKKVEGLKQAVKSIENLLDNPDAKLEKYGGQKMPAFERKRYIIMRDNLLKKIREAQ